MANPKGGKVYGLILPKKGSQVKSQPSTASNVFGNDSDEDDKSTGPVAPYKVATSSTKLKRQTQMDIDKALQEDPSIYEYDEVYDQMQVNKPQVGRKESVKAQKDKKPKYITGLLKAAEQKKKDDERRLERKVQKEREAEGEMYADKEKFVTSAYKKKMLEMQEEEEREKRQAAFEAMTDVTKQKDLSGFYRYLYRQTGGPNDEGANPSDAKDEDNKTNSPSENEIKQEPSSPLPHGDRVKEGPRSRSVSSSSRSSSASPNRNITQKKKGKIPVKAGDSSGAQCRRHDSSSSSSSHSGSDPLPSKGKQRVHSGSSSTSPIKTEKFDKSHSRKSTSKSPSRNRTNALPERQRSPWPRGRKHSPLLSKRDGDKTRTRRRSSSRSQSPDKDRDIRRSKSPQYRRDVGDRSHNDMHKQQRVPQAHTKDERRKRKRSRSPSDMASESRSPSPPVRKSKQSKEKTHTRDKPQRERNSVSKDTSPEDAAGDADVVDDNVKTSQKVSSSFKSANKSGAELSSQSKTGVPAAPVDPAKKVYPHHNTPEDIAAARKRYLQRKIARERGTMG